MSTLHPVAATYARHVNPAFVKLLGILGYGRVYTRAVGAELIDSNGNHYLDFLSGFGAQNLGHAHPRLRQALARALDDELPHVMHVGPAVQAAALGQALATAAGAPLEVALFATSGAEAVEAALKLARAATGRAGFISCTGGFHGTSLGTLSVMGDGRMRGPFEPLLAGCEQLPFGDLPALERALNRRKAAAFLVEPIQGEGGVVLPPPGYLASAAALCRRYGTLFVLDEVQTGLGRTGQLFGMTAERVIPDVLVLGKALGGGALPVSAALVSSALHASAYGTAGRFDLHGSTFSGYALGCVAALETLRTIADEGLAENAAARGQQLIQELQQRLHGHPFVREVRGRGLLVGIELGPHGGGLLGRLTAGVTRAVTKNVFGQWLAVRMLERGVVCQPAALRWDVLKLEPPLTITAEQIARVVEILGEVLDDYRDLGSLLADVTARLGRQALEGFGFP